jgi:hypothetical protein
MTRESDLLPVRVVSDEQTVLMRETLPATGKEV